MLPRDLERKFRSFAIRTWPHCLSIQVKFERLALRAVHGCRIIDGDQCLALDEMDEPSNRKQCCPRPVCHILERVQLTCQRSLRADFGFPRPTREFHMGLSRAMISVEIRNFDLGHPRNITDPNLGHHLYQNCNTPALRNPTYSSSRQYSATQSS